MLPEGVIKQLKKIVGKENISTDREDLICYSYDATNQSFLPDAVVFPGSSHDVSCILRLANRYEFPVCPRGAGSGFTGGSLPIHGGIVLSMERLNRILEIDKETLISVVEPGVVTGDLQEEVEKEGLFYPPDPTSLKFSTIGGNIAECAGGPRGLKYGVTKDYVLGLEVCLPTGEIINTGGRTLKGVVGYDLTRFIVGSEGTLGVITKAILRLLPLPSASKTILAFFSNMDDAARTVSTIIASKIIPATLEFIDGECIRCVEDYFPPLHSSNKREEVKGVGQLKNLEAVLLIEVDGEMGAVEKETLSIRGICFDNGAIKTMVARDRKEAKRLWEARRAVSPSLKKLNPHKLNEDIVVPRSRIPQLISGVRELARQQNLKVASFGHAGDGNIHVNFMINRDIPGEAERAERAVEELFRLTLKLGGTISGEHGIGITKAPYLRMELSEAEMTIMKKIKDVFDPKGILNPGKIFPMKS